MDSANNVIMFPSDNNRITKNPYDVAERLIGLKLETIEDTLDYIIPNIYTSFIEIGIDPSDEKMNILESLLRSIMSDHYSFEDEFNTFVDVFNTFTNYKEELTEVVLEQVRATQGN